MSGQEDLVLVRVGEAIELARRGDRAAARTLLAAVWAEVGDGGEALHRCAVAHTMADLQDEPADELGWDLRALAAGAVLTDEEVAAGGVAATSGFLPSLHLDLADVHRRMGEPALARQHVDRGLAALGDLADDGDREMISGGLQRIAEQVRGA